MTAAPVVVPLHVLGTDVDLHLASPGGELTTAVRQRWHLALREDRPAAEDQPDADAHEDTESVPVVEAVLLAADEVDDEPTAWQRHESVVRDQDLRRLLQRLTQAVTHAVITARTGELLMLHAAALADPLTGATAVFVAPGNTGKTTLCRTLGPARGYLTDETMGMRPDGTIVPYPKPLSTRRTDWAGVKDEQAPGDLGLTLPEATPWLAGIVLLHRDPDHEGPPLVEDLEPLDAVLALIPESSGFMRTERPLQWLAEVLDRTGGARRATYAEVADLEPLAAEICGRTSPW